MATLSEDYYLRRYYLENEDVPTQSMIKRKMTPKLAAVFFKDMDPKLKVVAGLEPPLAGGGSNWYVCPKTIFNKSRAVLKPIDQKHLNKLNHDGIVQFGGHALIAHQKILADEEEMKILESDAVWKDTIALKCHRFYDESVVRQSTQNTEFLTSAFEEFSNLYRTSLSNIEQLIHEGVIKDIKNIKDYVGFKMNNRYKILLKYQAISLSNSYTEKLMQDKASAKEKFIEQLETIRAETTEKYHDLKLDKQAAVERVRQFLECQKLACQAYVALKEKEECSKEMQVIKHRHEKKLKHLSEDFVNFELNLAIQKDRKIQELNSIWLKKVSHVVKKFQMYVSYCLKVLPEYADFFINMEKLMLLQVNEALDNPNAESIVAVEEERAPTPVPQAKPFYLFCDRGYKAKLDQELCPKPSGTSSSAQLLPAVIVNKRCMYAACDNFEQFTNKIKDYIHGYDAGIKDDLIYEHFVPVKYTSSQQLKEIKLESSLLQVLQQKMSNIDITQYSACGVPYCFCASLEDDKTPIRTNERATGEVGLTNPTSSNNKTVSDKSMMEHKKEPKIESYIKYLEPKTCGCVKTCKKHLAEHLPPYMINKSKFETVELPDYETCSITVLKKLVEEAKTREQRSPPVLSTPKTRDMWTQYSDEEFDWSCTCFSHSSMDLSSKSDTKTNDRFDLDKVSPSYMTSKPSSFAIDRAHSLKQLIDEAPELLEIFKKK